MFYFNRPEPKEFTGKLIDKRVSVSESEEGSSFVNELVVEEKNGKRSRLTVTEEIFDRAKIGMWVRRSNKGVELLNDAEQDSAGR